MNSIASDRRCVSVTAAAMNSYFFLRVQAGKDAGELLVDEFHARSPHALGDFRDQVDVEAETVPSGLAMM